MKSGELIEGGFLPAGSGREYVSPEVLRRLRRRTLARLRREVEPVEPAVLGRFLPAWHGIGRDLRGGDRLREVVAQLEGVALPVAAIESDILPARVSGYRPDSLDLACAGGELVWIGAGPGRVRLYLRENVPLLHPHPEEREHQLLDVLARRGASFFSDLVVDVGGADRAVLADLWELVWAGLVTNDAWEPLRNGTTLRSVPAATTARRARRARPTSSLPAARGRWSLVAPLLLPAATPRERARALAEVLLERHGVVTRAAVLAEGVPGGFTAVYGELRAMEEAGVCQRGYFIEGLGGAQFALPAAVERLRDLREADPRAEPVVVGAADPANPFGVTAPWPEAARKPARCSRSVAGAGRGPAGRLRGEGRAGTGHVRTGPVRCGNLSSGRCCRRSPHPPDHPRAHRRPPNPGRPRRTNPPQPRLPPNPPPPGTAMNNWCQAPIIHLSVGGE